MTRLLRSRSSTTPSVESLRRDASHTGHFRPAAIPTSFQAEPNRHGRARFRYAADPLCLASVAMYWVNRVWIKPLAWGHRGFFHDYLNDVLLIPVFLPGVLWLHRRLRLRPHDGVPSIFEISFHVVIWSICFLVVFPHRTWLFQRGGWAGLLGHMARSDVR